MTQDVIVDEFRSDHLPVVVTLVNSSPNMMLHTPLRQKCIDWRVFERTLHDAPQPRPPDTPAAINKLATSFTTLLQSALGAATTERPLPATYKQLPPRLLALIRRKRALRRRWQQTRCPRMRAELHAFADRVKAALNDHASESWDRGLDEASTDWVRLHRLCRRLSGTADPIRPLRHPDGTLRYDAEGRAELFADHLQHQFSPNPAEDPARALEVETAVAEQLGAPPPADEEVLFFSPSAVKKQAARLKLRKAPGPDGITNAALRHLPHRAVVTLMRLFNAILRTAHFPEAWKEAKVIMLPKKGKSVFDPASYRPISLLATQSKLFEAMLLPTIRRHFTPRPEQFGFRSEHSTTLQLSRVLHDITAALNKKEAAAAVFLDMEKAFDRVWHAGLVHRLLASDIPRRVVAIIRSFLLDRRFHVSVEGVKSSCRPITAGVPQGSCLSPSLYSIYTDDVPVAAGCAVSLFADDTAYIATAFNARYAGVKLQRSLDALPAWLAERRLTANAAKTQAIVFGRRHLPPPLQLQGVEIQWRPKATYLGVTLDRGLTMRHHIAAATGRAKAVAVKLRPVLQSSLPIKRKLALYKQYLRPHLTYAAPAWYALAAETHRRRLRAVQSTTLRRIVDAPRYVRNSTIQRDLKQESLDDFISALARRMFERADASGFQHLKNLAPLHTRPPDHRRSFPRELVRAEDSDD